MKDEWVKCGMFGRYRNPKYARSEERVRAISKELGDLLKYLVTQSDNHPQNAHLHLWYCMQTVRRYLDHYEQKLLDDLFHLGVYVPEKFDIRDLHIPKKKSPKRVTKRAKKTK